MRDHLDQFGSNTKIVVVTFADSESVAGYLERNDVPFPILVDASRSAYRSYGLDRGSFWRVWAPRVWWRYAQILRKDGFVNLRRATDDTRQLGGDFVIAPDGTLVYGFWGDGPDHRPDVATLATAARTAEHFHR